MRTVSWVIAAALALAAGAQAEPLTAASDGPTPVVKPAPKPAHPKPRPKAAPKPAPAAPTPVADPPPLRPPPATPVLVRSPGEVAASPAPLSDWRPLDAENTLIVDTDHGRMVVELRPEFAPLAVARVKQLARSGFYDGLLFHRVIENFVAQTGNPNNLDGGKSQEPNLPAEFTFRLGAEVPRTVAARPQGESEGFIGAQPYVSVDEIRMAMSPDRRVSAWGAYCAGVMGMGHDADPDSSNSEIFFMRDATRSLDRHYSVVGRTVAGLEVIRSLPVGEPPTHPDHMQRVRVLADLPDPERPSIYVLNTLSPQFWAIVDQARARRGADFSICDVEVPVRIVSPGRPAPKPAAKVSRR